MQMKLPIFPIDTKLINATCGFRSQDGLVYYLHSGQPIFCHDQNDIGSYRFIMGNLVETGLCTSGQLAKALGVSSRNIQRYAKQLNDQGRGSFFNRIDNRGQCHKFTDRKCKDAQGLLNQQLTQSEVARRVGLSEAAIRYHIKNGKLVKKSPIANR